jgi:pentatricopeptide repeat protein
MFPYTDADQMCITLRAWLDLEANQQPLSQQPEDELRHHYGHERCAFVPFEERMLDVSTLEMISMGAARSGNSNLMVLVWDVLEHCEHMPTETIYECTVIAFAKEVDGIRQAFMAMASMKQEGFPVSRALIRSFSTAIRSDLQTVDDALQVLLDDQAVLSGRGRNASSSLMSLESLNVVMSSYAERGETEQTTSILETMKENSIQANEDSYSFALEVLGKDIHRRKKVDDRFHVRKNVEIASKLLTRMEEDGIAPSADIIRNYVELLCLAEEVETATSIVEEFTADNACMERINNKTIYRVALANAEMGNITKAKELAKKMGEEIPVLHRKIRSKAQRFAHLNEIKERHNLGNQ